MARDYTKGELEAVYNGVKVWRAVKGGITHYGKKVGVTTDARGFGAIVKFDHEPFKSFYVYNKRSGIIEYVGPAPEPRHAKPGPRVSTKAHW